MARRTIPFLAVSLTAFVSLPVLAQPPDAPPDLNAAPQTQRTDAPIISTRDARRLAGEALHRLEIEPDTDKKQALLDEVDRLIEIVSTNDPDDASLLFLNGWRHALTGRSNDAHDQLRRFVETPAGRTEWRAFRLLGDLFVTEYPRLAQSNYDKAAALNPTAPSVLFGRSLCAAKLGAASSAIALAREALSGDEGNTIRYRSHLATLLRAGGQYDEAQEQAERALAMAVAQANASPQAAGVLSTIDRQYQSLISIVQARMNRSKNKSADDFIMLADYLGRRGQLAGRVANRDALRVLKTGIDEAEPTPPAALLEAYGVALGKHGRTQDAIEVFERLLEVAPGSAVATDWLSRLRTEPAGAIPRP